MKFTITSILSVLFLSLPAIAQETNETGSKRSGSKPEFLRLSESASGQPLSLDTAIVRYQDEAKSLTVDLIGAVHIGEGAYYQQLNRRFEQYDALLYELVAPEGTDLAARAQAGPSNPVSMLQSSIKNFLGMQSQLEKIDYTKPNFIHADMTPAKISQKMEERGDTALTLALSTLVEVMRQQNKASASSGENPLLDSNISLIELLENPQRARLLMAQQFVASGSLESALGGPLNQLLVVDRNAEAMRVLKTQIDKGHQKIGIFYGAAHLPDMDQRLLNDFHLQRGPTEWLPAWNLDSNKGKSIEPVSLMLQLLKSLD